MFIFSNLAISLDGKIGTEKRQLFPLGTREDQNEMNLLRLQSDAILMGANTLRAFRHPCVTQNSETQPINVVLSSALNGISPSWPFFKQKTMRRILIVGPESQTQSNWQSFQKKVRSIEKTSEIFVLKKPTSRNPIAVQIVRYLEKQGIQRLLIEGGGSVMWHFVEQNLIDEYHITLTPKILGGRNAPTLVDGKGFDPQQILSLKLQNSRIIGDEIFLVYSR